MSDPVPRPMSVEEYLRTEEKSPYKREYVGGFVYPLHGATRAHTGTSRAHALIAGNIYARLHRSALENGCRLYQSDMKLLIAGRSSFYYSDVMLVCEENQGDADLNAYSETAPCFVVEVLSKHTAQNDRKGKYMAYTALPGVQTYLIVEQLERRVYVYERQDEQWTLQDLSDGALNVPCLDMSLSLDEIYAGVLSTSGP